MPPSANPVRMDLPRPAAKRAGLTGTEIRRLLEFRELIKVESLTLPRALQQQLLEILERARPRGSAPPSVPEMSRGELIRAIRWRVGTLTLAGAAAGVEFVVRHRPKRSRARPSSSPQQLRAREPRKRNPLPLHGREEHR